MNNEQKLLNGDNQNNRTVALAALKVFYSESKNSIELYGDVMLASIYNFKTSKQRLDISEIKNLVKQKFAIDMPLDMALTIIKRLKRDGYIEHETKYKPIEITDKGRKKQKEIIKKIEASRRQENELLNKLKKHLPEQDENKLRENLKLFIQNNSYLASIILSGNENNHRENLDVKVEEEIKKFFEMAEKNDPNTFEYLKNVVFGQIVASTLLNKESNYSLNDMTVYLDTNIIFGLLELHDENINKSVKESVDLIQKNKGKTKIFEHTKEEIILVLKGFFSKSHLYAKNIPVHSIYYIMYNKGYDFHHVKSLIDNLDSKLSNFNISVSYSNNSNECVDQEYFHALTQQKQEKINYSPRSIEADCRSIQLIRNLRGNKKSNCFYLHKSKAIFLSSDKTLVYFTKSNHIKNNPSTVPEAFTPGEITGILWLHNVGCGPDTVLHNFLRWSVPNHAVESRIWDKFIEKLEIEKEQGNATQDDIDRLLAEEHTAEILRGGKLQQIDELISPKNIKKIRQEKENINLETRVIREERNKLLQGYARALDAESQLFAQIDKNAISYVDKKIKWERYVIQGFFIIVCARMMFTINNIESFATIIGGCCALFGLSRWICQKIDQKRDDRISKVIIREKEKLNLKK